MGGKTKHTQRTKNNAKPSNSSRSAELLGSMPTFVGFSAHSDVGIVPFAPGFSKSENLPEPPEANLSPQLQVILRKMSKKDPTTKKKALQEFIDVVSVSDVDTVKSILPLWPKLYQNLAFDTEHNVRELSQTVLQLLVSKSKKAIAPFLKQIGPVWLASQFDTYAPAGSIAASSFRSTFSGNVDRTQEVCLHCQSEIMEYTFRNLTFHTASTLASEKGLTAEEAELKYQCLVVSSLKTLSFFIEHTGKADDLSQVQLRLQHLIDNQKFWSYSKHKVAKIKAAWFEFVYHLLQSSTLLESIMKNKIQLIAACFQNIDEGDPLVAPQVWGCILLLQSTFDDWSTTVNFRTSILPKLSSLLRNGFNNNVQAICPNLLPFFSKLSQKILRDVDYYAFQKQFFDDIKSAIYLQNTNAKSDYSTIIRTYFECLRFVLKSIKNDINKSEDDKKLSMDLLEENILEPIEHFLPKENVIGKNFYHQASALIAFWAEKKGDDDCLYTQLLKLFWKRVFSLIDGKKDVEEHYLANLTEFIYCLRSANIRLDEQKVKFVEPTDATIFVNQAKELQNSTASLTFIDKELKLLVITMVRMCLENTIQQKTSKYISHLSRLIKMFSDSDFYAHISPDESLQGTLNLFVDLIDQSGLKDEASEIILHIVFEILYKLEKAEQFAFIEDRLLKIPRVQIQNLVLEQLLSYPLCCDNTIVSQPAVSAIIIEAAREIILKKSKDKFNLLHKCFFQTESGEILIGSKTVDTILDILSEPLNSLDEDDLVDACGSFIAQIMPVVCSNDNSSITVRHNIFLKLFKFTMERTVCDYISEDTLWEITTCWQDALSSEDIVLDTNLLQSCSAIVKECLDSTKLLVADVEKKADAMAKFITCSTETITDENVRSQMIDKTLIALLKSDTSTSIIEQKAENYCLYLESLKSFVTPVVELINDDVQSIELNTIFRRSLLNICTIKKLICKENTEQKNVGVAEESEEEVTEDYCDPNVNLITYCSDLLLAEILKCINIALIGDSLVNIIPKFDVATETTILELSERVKMFLNSESPIIEKVMERILQLAAKEIDSTHCRSLSSLVHCQKYAQFEENATILLAEDLSEYFVTKNALKAYVNSLQYLLPKLEPKAISFQSAIMQTNPSEIWIRAAVFRCLIINNFKASVNDKSDKRIIESALNFITEITEKQNTQKDTLLYNVDVQKQSNVHVNNAVEYINLLVELLNRFPYELTIKHWDAIRIGLSSWVLSISKSVDGTAINAKAAFFTVSVFKLFEALTKFIAAEKQKSSTEFLTNVIEEWENLFAREVNVVLFKSFYRLCSLNANSTESYACFLDEIENSVELIDYSVVYNFCKASTSITLDNVCNFLLKNFSSPINSVRSSSVHILKQLTILFVAADNEAVEKQMEAIEDQGQYPKMHFLHRLEDYITRYDLSIRKYLNEFSFKLTEIGELQPINPNEAFSFLFLWDCIIFACAKSPVSLRSVYTDWLNENKYEENLLHFLFRAMPVEILKNYDSKIMNTDLFRELSWTQIKRQNLTLEKYVCHLYAEVMRKLPAVLRRWWNKSPSRQKTFVDKLTTNFVSPLICNEELKAIGKKEKHENMQVTVHTSTREVLAVYSIDEARMELVITLAQNYPLGGVKVECGKQIGGRSHSRNVGMQLTIFLTHQNGTIFDGLSLWKKNLDKKFEGVEECYVCYTVIHQDTCQLPKLTCKTCKKKFHGPCLYKWFTTSSKSTCPICRNVF